MGGNFLGLWGEKLLCKPILLPYKSVQVKNVSKTSEEHVINPHVNFKANLDAKLADRPTTLELFCQSVF